MKPVLQKPADLYEARGRLDPAGFEQHVRFRTYPPPADMTQFVEHFWTISWNETGATYYSEEVMHRPYVDVFVSRQESGIQGTFRAKRTYVAAGSGRIAGVRFRPGAFHAFWDGALTDLQDKIVELRRVFPLADDAFVQDLAGLDDEATADELLKLLRSKQPQADAYIDLVNDIIAAVETDENLQSVASVAKAFARSERWLQQFFRDYVGFGLKWFIQRRRLLAAARQIRESDRPDWAAIAYDLGYSSQQHFITDFKRVTEKTPLQYKKDLTIP